MKISFKEKPAKSGDTLVLTAFEGEGLGATGQSFDKQAKGALSTVMDATGFSGKTGEIMTYKAPPGVNYDRVLVLGLGKSDDVSEDSLQQAGAALFSRLDADGVKDAALTFDKPDNVDGCSASLATQIAFGAKMNSYTFNEYKTKGPANDNTAETNLSLTGTFANCAKKKWTRLNALSDGIFLTYDLMNEPPNKLYPETYAERIKAELEPLGVTVKVYDEDELEKMGAGSLLSVGQGSAHPTRMVVMEYKGDADREDFPVGVVGKGVTFDSGGISIKPSAGMADMKYDMGGSAAVVGMMKALAQAKAGVNVVTAVSLTENMPDGNAINPGSVVKSMSGQTIEITNTDAEGRRAMADAMTHLQREYKPEQLLDIATLTGAAWAALGAEYAAVMSNDDDLAGKIVESGEKTKERFWRLPLDERYNAQLASDVADFKDMGGRAAGAQIAAHFLSRFVEGKTRWAHLDIAGPGVFGGAPNRRGFGVKLLEHFVRAGQEKPHACKGKGHSHKKTAPKRKLG